MTSQDVNKLVKHSNGKYYIVAEILSTGEVRCVEVFPKIIFEDMHTQAIFDSIELTHISALTFDNNRNHIRLER